MNTTDFLNIAAAICPDRDLMVFDLLTQETMSLLRYLDGGYFLEGTGLAWSPDDQYIYYPSLPGPEQRPHMVLSRCSATIPYQT